MSKSNEASTAGCKVVLPDHKLGIIIISMVQLQSTYLDA